MKTVLFVDDELVLLEVYKAYFEGRGTDWKTFQCSNPTEVLPLLKNNRIDIIVSDFNMPGMNGGEVLAQVRENFPWVIRVIITGGADDAEKLIATHFAHRCLIKPQRPRDIASELENIFMIYKSDISRIVRTALTGVSTLPILSKTFTDMLQELNRGDAASLKKIGEIIAKDPSMSANILKILASRFFRGTASVSKVEHAVTMLGLNRVKNLILTAKTLDLFPTGDAQAALIDNVITRCTLCARLMSAFFTIEMAAGNATQEEHDLAESIGMLHDVGKLVLASMFPDIYHKVTKVYYNSDEAYTALEKHFLGVTHAEVAAYLFSLWALPSEIPQTIAEHSATSEFNQSGSLYVKAIRYSVLAAELIEARMGNDILNHPIMQSNRSWMDCVVALAKEIEVRPSV